MKIADGIEMLDLPAVLENGPSVIIEVLSHETEKPYIQAEIPPVRMTQLEANLKNVSDEQRQRILPLYENLKANYTKFRAEVTGTLTDGEKLPYCGGIEIIYTPGHTKGHISIYLRQSKLLISGDIMSIENQFLIPAPPFTIIDKSLAAQSLHKLTHYDVETVICYHGGLYNKDVNKCIAKLASEYKEC